MLEYYLILTLVFFSLYAGMILAFTAKEELRDGRKYFLLAEKILASFVLALILLFLKLNYYIIAISSISFLIIFISPKIKIKDQFIYPLFAIIFFILWSSELFLVYASIVFIYSLFAGTLFTEKLIKEKKFKSIKKIFVNFVSFLIIGVGLWLIFK